MPRPDGEMRNPFRNESDAFRVLVMILVAAAIVLAAAELVGSWLGVVLGLIAICAGIWATLGWLREALGENEDPPVDPDLRRREPDGSGDVPPA
jgi:hypothetical protein